ncbi:hypothetical protein BU15DRAFT_77047 [Melanogaster broomeanus]|nr:hypothetical protein BU15DRAFT_77047 [Melanogaster broomeanus]
MRKDIQAAVSCLELKRSSCSDVQQNLRKEYGDLKQAIRSGSTGWFRVSRSSSSSATVHLEQCQGLVQRIQETIEGNLTANIRSGRAPSTTSGRNITSAPQPTQSGSQGASTRTASPAHATSVTDEIPIRSPHITDLDPPPFSIFNSTVPSPAPTPAAQQTRQSPTTSPPSESQLPFDPESFARLVNPPRIDPELLNLAARQAEAGGGEVKVYSNCITGQGSNSVGTTMNVGGYRNTGSAITYKRRQ